MDRFEITVHNQSNRTQAYTLLFDVPEVSNSPKIFRCVFGSFPEVFSPAVELTFQLQSQFYCIVGTLTDWAIGINATVGIHGSQLVTLAQGDAKGSSHYVTLANNGGFAGISIYNKDEDGSDQGCFAIECDKSFSHAGGVKYFIGFGIGTGIEDSSDQPTKITPVAIWTPRASTSYVVKPMTNFLLSRGYYQAGNLIDVKSISKPLEIDFAGHPGETRCTVIDQPNFKWGDVEFEKSPTS